MTASIYSINKTLYAGEVEKVIARTPQGEITVLKDHLPIIATLVGPAVELVDAEGKRSAIPLESGFIEVRPESEVVIVVHA
ncbi:MAG: hypothetical protein Q8R13_02070 [bacterium]|nr:hypothetical protein [bacterium]MDZ4296017.1 hypothetical protein [Patescibacteria group bacterium]